MKLNNCEIDIKSLVKELSDGDNIFKLRKNDIYLSDNDISVLNKYGINYMNYSSLSRLIFDVEEILNEESFDDLEELSRRLSDLKYYNYTNK